MIGVPIQANQDDIHLEIESDLSVDEADLIGSFEAINLKNKKEK